MWEGVDVPMGMSRVNIEDHAALDKSKTKDNKYDKMSGEHVDNLENQRHLDEEQKKLTALLEEMSKVFQGKVSTRDGIKVDFELKPNGIPKYSPPYLIPVALEQVTKNAITMMCEQGILKAVHKNTEWAAPCGTQEY